jgi:nucleoside-diphosphate-sugar epimerase
VSLAPGDQVLVTGGAGYLGAATAEALVAAGYRVRVLDRLLHGQEDVAAGLAAQGVEVVRGDVRDAAARAAALDGADAVVHLAAIVGDPACAREPEEAEAVNVDATLALAALAGDRRVVFASTCSNYGRMVAADGLVDEDAPLAPVSLYADQKVRTELALAAAVPDLVRLRFATLFGVAPRMRFDLTVNEFTRDLWAGRRLEVFGEWFWRPYVHVREAARAIVVALGAPDGALGARVFNVGATAENHRKADLVTLIRERVGTGEVAFVPRDEDPRDYRVDCGRVTAALGFAPARTVRDGIAEIADALDAGRWPDPFDPRFVNVA